MKRRAALKMLGVTAAGAVAATAGGLAWLKHQLSSADVLVQNLRPGTMDALGLDTATLRALNPRLVYCSLWAYGHKGPMHLHPGYEPMMQAFSGIFSVNGGPEGQGSRVGLSVLDLGTGLWTALGCIAALLRRETTGEGGVVDTSLFETALAWLNVNLTSFQVNGGEDDHLKPLPFRGGVGVGVLRLALRLLDSPHPRPLP